MSRKILALLIVCLLPIGCGSKQAQKASGEIKIGISLPLSGALAAYGKSTLEGINLRVEEANAAGGVNGVKLKLLTEDNAGDATTTINAYNKLAGSDKCVAVIGPITSTCALAVRRTAAKQKVPVLSPTATNDKVTQAHAYLFRACFNDSFQGTVVANFMIQQGRKAATLTDINSDYSKGLAKNFAEAFAHGGGEIAAEEKYQQKDTDFSTQLKKIKDSGAEILFIPGYVPELPLIIKQSKVVGLRVKLCGADGWDNDETINGSGDAIEGAHIVGAFSVEDERPQVRNFLSAWAQKTAGGRPGTFEALGYDSASLLIEALRNGDSAEAVQAGLRSIKNFPAVTGSISIRNGDAVKSAVILKIVKDGERFVAKYVTTIAP
jgi:branched-chain amino acid transport system substrate-binding protein